ncbi:general substrate transporter [Mollisia scopiformis]|uniref:General substrate transporter n=1 Tax=Mollisia scopiformis TaxID=149040 RepID=A0A194X8K3_MOLSC|nr:general substrate transporter [Mollisia scopiformis]KUJ16500.1 general substrate transporter [Mollisia scopiformis]
MEKELHTTTQVEDSAPGITLSTSEAVAKYEENQHLQTRLNALKENWRGVIWCLYSFFICCMFGYDSLAGSAVISLPAFRQTFGRPYDGDYVVDANWQLGFQAATLGGIVLGGFITGFAAQKCGRQICIFAAYFFTIGGVVMQYFSSTPAEYFGAKILTGLPLGVFTTIAPTYASEIAPLAIRGALTSGMNFSIVLGQLIGFGVMRKTTLGQYTGPMSYRILFAVQWGFAAVGLAFLPFFPESPYWLVAHGQIDKARRNIVRLHNSNYDVDGHLAEIKRALDSQRAENETSGSYKECFNHANWRRTLAAVSTIFIQNACGNSWVIGYMSYFMQLAGLSAAKAFDATVGLSGMMAVGNICGWFLVEKFGRRGTALYGCSILCVTLLVIGIVACINTTNAIWVQVAFMAIWSFVYQASIGSCAGPIIAENPTSRLRGPTQALSTMMNGLSGSIWAFCLPYAVNPDQGNMGGKISFVFGGILVFAVVFIFFMIPESKGRTYIEMDELWSRGVPPRKFASTQLLSLEGKGDEVEGKHLEDA